MDNRFPLYLWRLTFYYFENTYYTFIKYSWFFENISDANIDLILCGRYLSHWWKKKKKITIRFRNAADIKESVQFLHDNDIRRLHLQRGVTPGRFGVTLAGRVDDNGISSYTLYVIITRHTCIYIRVYRVIVNIQNWDWFSFTEANI